MRFFKILFAICLLTACNNDKGADSIITPEEMIPILEDIHVVDAMLSHKNIRKGDQEALDYYQYIYDKHHIDKKSFDASMAYYAKYPKELRKVYPQILKRLEIRDSLFKLAEESKIDTLQLWKGNKEYKVEKYTMQTLPVSIPVKFQKTYSISAEYKIYPDSRVKEITPYFTFVAPDTTYVLSTKQIKVDTTFQKFEITEMVTDSMVTLLKGDFFPSEKDSLEQFKHYEIRNIQIMTTDIDFEKKLDSLTLE